MYKRQVLFGCESEQYEGSIDTSDELRQPLKDILANAAPMSEEDYFSLSGRFDILELVTDLLTAKRLMDAKGRPVESYSRADYAAYIAKRASN